jgi:hypothetical protein
VTAQPRFTETDQRDLAPPVIFAEGPSESVQRVPSHNGPETRIAAVVIAPLLWSRFRLLLYALGRELGSLRHRIQILRRKKLAHLGLDLGQRPSGR